MRARVVRLLLCTAVILTAQTPLVYQGQPLKIPQACSEEDVQTLELDCSANEPCPALLELSAAGTAGPKLFLAGNLHTPSATIASLLLVSSDEGHSWTEAHQRVRGALLDSLEFLDPETGWVSGHMLGALPRDPFFLVTTNGGQSWQQRPVFGEPSSGVIETFHFTSRMQGELLLDRIRKGESGVRYGHYETQSGGGSWTPVQLSTKPLTLRQPRTAESEWRVTPDAKSSAYRVERRRGAQWQTLASFAIRAGECRPAELVTPEPKVESEPAAPSTPPLPRPLPTLRKKP